MCDLLTDEARDGYMLRALEAARRGWGRTHPNPMVGAVIVEDGRIVADGFHERAGDAHAEIMALRNLGRKPAEGATLFVTLEPCSTKGRTGACTVAIIEAGLRHVVVGATDPNPAHAGQGLAILREAGVQVEAGVLRRECEDLNLIFNHAITQRTPFVAAKIATTLDGKMATRERKSKWITGVAARADVMRWRRLFPAIAVGAGTVLADNPQLTSRIGTNIWCPLRLVFDHHGRTVAPEPENWPTMYGDGFEQRTVLVCGQAGIDKAKERELAGRGVEVVPCADDFDGVRRYLMAKECPGLLVEGGPTLLEFLFRQQTLDYVLQYIAPNYLADAQALAAFHGLCPGEIAGGVRLREVRQAVFGEDILVRGHLAYPETEYKTE